MINGPSTWYSVKPRTMSKNDFLSALNLEFGADILDSTEYLRQELQSALLVEGDKSCASLRFTQDMLPELEQIAPNIDMLTWCLHEPEQISELYKAQAIQGANVCIATTSEIGFSRGRKEQVKAALSHAIREAEGNDAVWFMGEVDLIDLVGINLYSEDEVRKAKLSILDQVVYMKEQGVHGMWVHLAEMESLSVVQDALELSGDVPVIYSIDAHLLDFVPAFGSTDGICIRFDSLADAYASSAKLTQLQKDLNKRFVLELSSLGLLDHDAFEVLEQMKVQGLIHYRSASRMSRHERVLLYSFV